MAPEVAHQFDLRSLARDESGVAALEFALILPFMLVLLAGVVDGSRVLMRSMQVRAAAQAGADYARTKGGTSAAIIQAAQGSTPLAVTATVDQYTACVSGQTITQTQATICPTGGSVGQYVSVAAESAFAPIIPWPAAPTRLQAQALVRVR